MKEFVKKIIRELEKSKDFYREQWNKYLDDDEAYGNISAYDDAIKIVNKFAEEYNNGWIPCSERLPNEKGEYLITTNFGVTSALYLPNSKKWVDTIEQYYEYSCVAWQPLPKAYKTEF